LKKLSAAEELNLTRFIAEFRRFALLPPTPLDGGLMPDVHPYPLKDWIEAERQLRQLDHTF
jgi:hypothetical protein